MQTQRQCDNIPGGSVCVALFSQASMSSLRRSASSTIASEWIPRTTTPSSAEKANVKPRLPTSAYHTDISAAATAS
jgi:hypothetical protein